ncbi:isopentenyl-diphosphate Delta-isomerase [Thermodesulfobacteriota bacterium]
MEKTVTGAKEHCSDCHVVLVDEKDIPQGSCGKLAAHTNGGVLHRAFSIFIINEENKILLQQRATSKYHCPGLWSNSCCSHPRPDRDVLQEATTRLRCELGFTTDLHHVDTCTYRVPVDNDLTEWEVDHIFVGEFPGTMSPNPEEVADIRWITLEELQGSLASKPSDFTPWLLHILPPFADWLRDWTIKQ